MIENKSVGYIQRYQQAHLISAQLCLQPQAETDPYPASYPLHSCHNEGLLSVLKDVISSESWDSLAGMLYLIVKIKELTLRG